MSILTKYFNNIRALQFLHLFRFVVLLLVGIILSKTNIGISQIGTYETFLLISGAVCFFWLGGMLQAMLSKKRQDKSEKDSAYFNIFLIFTVLGIISALAVFLLRSEIATLVGFSGGRIPYLKILLAYIVLSCPVNLVEYIYLIENKTSKIIIYATVVFPIQLLATILPVIFLNDLGYGLYGLVFATLLKFIWLCIIILKYSTISFSAEYIKSFLKLSAPLIFSVLLIKGIQYVDSFLVSFKYDEATFAQFRYGAREFPPILLALTALAEAMTSRFANNDNLHESLQYIKTESRHLMHILVPLAMVLIIVSKFFYPLVFNEDFESCAQIFNIFCFATIFRFIMPNSILIGKKINNPILAASAINILINVLLGLLLINFIGISGVAVAYLIGNIVEKLILVRVVRSLYGIKLSEYLDLKMFVFYMILMMICLVASYWIV